MQQRLSDAVAQRGMQPSAVIDKAVDLLGQFPEAVDRAAAQQFAHRRAEETQMLLRLE
jgi:hypothetical protein